MKAKTCDRCGLEAADNPDKPYDPFKIPCRFCKRNPQAESRVSDFFSETWCLDDDNTPIIEQPDPHEQALLRLMHDLVNIYA